MLPVTLREGYCRILLLGLIVVAAGCGMQPAPEEPEETSPASIDEDPLDEPGDVHEPASEPGDDEPVFYNSAPLADAGADLTVLEGQGIVLDGSASSDPDGDPLTYRWSVEGGDTVVAMSLSDTAAPSLTAPTVAADTVLVFTLVVSDGMESASDSVEVRVLALLEAAQTGPVADAGPDQNAPEGSLVTLDGGGSFGDALTFEWTQLSGPPVVLTGANQALAMFTAPRVENDAVLSFELAVSSGDLASIDEVLVTVTPVVTVAPPPVLPPPPPPPPPPADQCPNDPNKTEPGICGCGLVDLDADGDGTMDCSDLCPADPTKVAPGTCGCGVPEPLPGACGCGASGGDADGDGATDCADGCPNDPAKTQPGVCGCGMLDTDGDGDGMKDCVDGCPNDAAKITPGVCGCGVPDADSDGDGAKNCADGCPNDPGKTQPGVCGCGIADTDSDGDGAKNCVDGCPNDASKTTPGVCGCGVPDTDSDGDGIRNCADGCPNDPAKTQPGICGCGVADTDTDGDGARNCVDGCPNDASKTTPGTCGCGVAETDRDGDSTPDCADGCPDDPGTTNPAFCIDASATRDTDWELYMLRLVNRARRDPSGEAARIGSSTTDTSAPVQPLAFDAFVADAANNHDDWMHDNFGSVSSGRAPDSFTHYETLDGLSSGTPATGTPSFTGYRVGDRLLFAGYPWSNYGENIQTNYSSADIPITKSRIDSAHLGWWNSSGHRANMLTSSFTAFGFHVETRVFTPPRGGLNAPFDNLMYATQVFGRPQATPRNHILGLIYVDRDGNNAWTPRPPGDALREGLAGVDFDVFLAGTATFVTTGTTLGHGAVSVRVTDGNYDLLFSDARISGGPLLIENITVAGANIDLGDFEVGP